MYVCVALHFCIMMASELERPRAESQTAMRENAEASPLHTLIKWSVMPHFGFSDVHARAYAQLAVASVLIAQYVLIARSTHIWALNQTDKD